MKRHLVIFAGPDTLPSGYCSIMVLEDNKTLHRNSRVRYGLPICNIMEEWDCYKLVYTSAAREKFLGKRLDPALLT
jgi:hypothetical protein